MKRRWRPVLDPRLAMFAVAAGVATSAARGLIKMAVNVELQPRGVGVAGQPHSPSTGRSRSHCLRGCVRPRNPWPRCQRARRREIRASIRANAWQEDRGGWLASLDLNCRLAGVDAFVAEEQGLRVGTARIVVCRPVDVNQLCVAGPDAHPAIRVQLVVAFRRLE